MCRDDLHNIVDEGTPFKTFCPNWETSVLWKEWTDFGVKCLSKGELIRCLYTHAHCCVEGVTLPPDKGGPRTDTEHIPITLEESGHPVLPDIRMGNRNKTKRVQSMLREYCLAHIRQYPMVA
jgi:hypothetical protein